MVERGEEASDSYVQGFIVPVQVARREDYRKLAEDAWAMFRDYGALHLVEAWGDDVPNGKVTDFRRAVKAEPDEAVVFSFIEWPSRAVCDAATERMMHDECMQPPEGAQMPFDMQRMVIGGFAQVVSLDTGQKGARSAA
ncbi:MAG: DUF1428 domain-containing protein [Thiomonas sp.]|nr:DUF1428 domain-containing protein [Thiomonas sp.]